MAKRSVRFHTCITPDTDPGDKLHCDCKLISHRRAKFLVNSLGATLRKGRENEIIQAVVPRGLNPRIEHGHTIGTADMGHETAGTFIEHYGVLQFLALSYLGAALVPGDGNYRGVSMETYMETHHGAVMVNSPNGFKELTDYRRKHG